MDDWRLYDRATGRLLAPGDETTVNGSGHFSISVIDGRMRRVLVMGDGPNDSPRTVGAASINAQWRRPFL